MEGFLKPNHKETIQTTEEFLDWSKEKLGEIADRNAVEEVEGTRTDFTEEPDLEVEDANAWYKRRELRRTLEAILAGASLMFATPAEAKNSDGENASTEVADSATGRNYLAEFTIRPSPHVEEQPFAIAEQISAPTAFQQEIDQYVSRFYQTAKGRNEIAQIRELAAGSGYGTGDLTYQEYLSTQVEFIHPDTKEPLPERLQERLREILVGQAMKESSFNIKAVSKAGAVGMLQQLPETILDEGFTVAQVKNSLPLQAEITGRYFAKIYAWVQEGMGTEAKEALGAHYSAEEIESEIMPTVLLVGYIAGHRVASEMLKQYFEDETNLNKNLSAGDLVIDMLNFGKESNVGHLKQFGEQTRSYATKIMAFSHILNNPLELGGEALALRN